MSNINEPPPVKTPPPPRTVPERSNTNGLALASLTLGIVGFIFNPLLIVSILALIFGIVGLRRAPLLGRKNMALVGIVLAIIGGIVSIVVTSAIVGSIGKAASSISSPQASAIAAEPSATPNEYASDPPSEDAEPASDVPEGYMALSKDVYFKWGKLDNSNQFLSKKNAEVITPNGCGSLYITAVLLDSDGTNIGSAYATASGLGAGDKAKVQFLITEDNVDQIKTNEVTCY